MQPRRIRNEFTDGRHDRSHADTRDDVPYARQLDKGRRDAVAHCRDTHIAGHIRHPIIGGVTAARSNILAPVFELLSHQVAVAFLDSLTQSGVMAVHTV